MTKEAKTRTYEIGEILPIQVPFSYQGTKYVLCEADGEASERYALTVTPTELQLDAQGNPRSASTEGWIKSRRLLVHLCSYTVEVDGSGEPKRDDNDRLIPKARVPMEQVSKWPNRLVKQLFETAKEISELDEQEEEGPLDEQSGIGDGSG